MYRSVENEVPAGSLHSVGMQPRDLPNGGIPTECLFVCEHHFLPSDANLRLAKLGYYKVANVAFVKK
ncbi:MAG: hypothetical protein LBQ66_06940 [Planctomycetaceae bacterium]|jgi:hypothetical protein|nr:hypothetical protein [Planctomycetaceae bacterium]